jgi:hypothetical protein
MTIDILFQKLLGLYWELFLYDIHVFSQPWIYWWLLIPALCYLCFFCIKWAILLYPIYIIPLMLFRSLLYLLLTIIRKDKKR